MKLANVHTLLFFCGDSGATRYLIKGPKNGAPRDGNPCASWPIPVNTATHAHIAFEAPDICELTLTNAVNRPMHAIPRCKDFG